MILYFNKLLIEKNNDDYTNITRYIKSNETYKTIANQFRSFRREAYYKTVHQRKTYLPNQGLCEFFEAA